MLSVHVSSSPLHTLIGFMEYHVVSVCIHIAVLRTYTLVYKLSLILNSPTQAPQGSEKDHYTSLVRALSLELTIPVAYHRNE